MSSNRRKYLKKDKKLRKKQRSKTSKSDSSVAKQHVHSLYNPTPRLPNPPLTVWGSNAFSPTVSIPYIDPYSGGMPTVMQPFMQQPMRQSTVQQSTVQQPVQPQQPAQPSFFQQEVQNMQSRLSALERSQSSPTGAVPAASAPAEQAGVNPLPTADQINRAISQARSGSTTASSTISERASDPEVDLLTEQLGSLSMNPVFSPTQSMSGSEISTYNSAPRHLPQGRVMQQVRRLEGARPNVQPVLNPVLNHVPNRSESVGSTSGPGTMVIYDPDQVRRSLHKRQFFNNQLANAPQKRAK